MELNHIALSLTEQWALNRKDLSPQKIAKAYKNILAIISSETSKHPEAVEEGSQSS